MGVQDHNQRHPGDTLFHLFEAGMDVVGGAAGARPGSQRRSRRQGGAGVGEIGRWLGDKVSWLLDDEDRDEDWQRSQPPFSRQERERPVARAGQGQREGRVNPSVKPDPVAASRRSGIRSRRPLGVIPHPAPPLLQEAAPPEAEPQAVEEEWPDEQMFRVERWERGQPAAAPPPAGDPGALAAARANSAGERQRPRSSRRRLPRA